MKRSTMVYPAVKYITAALITAAASNVLYAQTTVAIKKQDVPSFFQGRWGGMSFVLNNKIYVAGGYTGSTTGWLNDLNEYDAASDKWNPKNNMSSASGDNRSAGVAFVINGKAYLGLGAKNFLSTVSTLPSSNLNDMMEYDAATDKWNQKASLPGTGRTGSAVFILNNKAYIIGGSNGSSGGMDEVWEYDPSGNKWTAKAKYPMPIADAQAFAINGKGYVMGGTSGNAVQKTYEYDPTADKWTPKADFIDSARYGGIAYTYSGKGYVMLGGAIGANYPVTTYLYDPAKNYWTFSSDKWVATGRLFGTGQVIGNKLYAGCGWRYDSPNQTFFKDWYETDLTKMLGINDAADASLKLSVYPNPAVDVIHITSPLPGNIADFQYAVYSLSGQRIMEGTMNNSMSIYTGSLAGGHYVLDIYNSMSSAKAIITIANQ